MSSDLEELKARVSSVPAGEMVAVYAETVRGLIEENERLRTAAKDVLSSLEYDQYSYDRNGPSFTSLSGTQYEYTAHVLACSKERAAILRTALEGVKK